MKEKKKISYFTAGFLQDTRSWILMPSEVEFLVSEDGIDFRRAGEVVRNKVEARDYTVRIRDFSWEAATAPYQARFIKVKARNFGKLPEWHLGAGFDAFIFVDEMDFH
jgi:hypothetical protein